MYCFRIDYVCHFLYICVTANCAPYYSNVTLGDWLTNSGSESVQLNYVGYFFQTDCSLNLLQYSDVVVSSDLQIFYSDVLFTLAHLHVWSIGHFIDLLLVTEV